MGGWKYIGSLAEIRISTDSIAKRRGRTSESNGGWTEMEEGNVGRTPEDNKGGWKQGKYYSRGKRKNIGSKEG